MPAKRCSKPQKTLLFGENECLLPPPGTVFRRASQDELAIRKPRQGEYGTKIQATPPILMFPKTLESHGENAQLS